jgi:uncharacterized protein YyaL (SSP411 family)
MVVGFTGTREGMTDAQQASVLRLLLELDPHGIHHGDSVGADAQSHDLPDSYSKNIMKTLCRKTTQLALVAPALCQNREPLRGRGWISLSAIVALGIAWLPPAPAGANYRAKASEATDYIQRAFYDQEAGLYRVTSPVDPKTLPYATMWDNGLQFSVLTKGTRYEPAKYRAPLYEFTKGLEKYWDKDAPIPGFDAYFASLTDDDKYYDDNAWLVLELINAYHVTKDSAFLDWARRTHKFVLSGWDQKLGGGIYWYQKKRESKNTCINAPAAASALELYKISKNPIDLEWAKRLYTWTNAHLQDKDGLYWDNINLEGKIQDWKFTYNTALMIRTNIDLWRATKEAKYLREARRVSDASLQKWVNPGGAFSDSARFNNWLSEALLMTYEATRDLKYLNAVRRHADFGHRYVRDVRDGGYWDQWTAETRAPDTPKTFIENAAAARIFWLLAPYPDVEELRSSGQAAAKAGDLKKALDFFQQAFASTAGAAPTKTAPANTAATKTAA